MPFSFENGFLSGQYTKKYSCRQIVTYRQVSGGIFYAVFSYFFGQSHWKAGKTEVIYLHGGLRLCRLAGHPPHIIGNNKSSLDLKKKKSASHIARLTIHKVDVRTLPYFSDKLVKDRRWQNDKNYSL